MTAFHVQSLIGFAFVFLAVSALASLAGGVAWRLLGGRARGYGPATERAATTAALVLPIVAGVAAVLPLVAHAVVSRGRRDHCLRIAGHLHFCFQHGVGWAESLVAVSLLTLAVASLVVRAARGWRARSTARRSLRALHASSSRVAGHADVRLVPGARRFCFVAGDRQPVIYVSASAWHALEPQERAAMLAHERAHALQRDLRSRRWLAFAAALGAPRVADRLLRAWAHATERLCDAMAAREVGDAAVVASAILTLAGARPPVASAAFVQHEDDVSGRIEAVLREGPMGHAGASTLWQTSWRLALGALLASLVFFDQIHGWVERVVAWLA